MVSDAQAFALLVELYRLGGRIAPQGERLTVAGPAQIASSGLPDDFARAKPALLALLGGCGQGDGTREGVPLSQAQQEIWAIERAYPGTTRFNLTSTVLLRGRFDLSVAADALAALIARHAAVRTRFAQTPLAAPRQFVHTASHVALDIERASMPLPDDPGALLRSIARAQNARRFDLAGDPLLGLHVLVLGDDHVLLTLRRHHIASDGVSFALLVEDFCGLYRAFARGDSGCDEASLGYPAFVAYETAALERQGRQALRAWWSDTLARAGTDTETLPSVSDAPTRSLRFVIDAPTVEALRDLSRRCGESLFATTFALFRVLLEAYDARGAQRIGVDASMRDAVEFERSVGLFINRLPLVHRLDPDLSFESMIGDIGRTIRAALSHKWLAHHEIASLRRADSAPLFAYLFGFHNNAHASFELPECRLVERFAHREHEQDVPFVCYLTDVGAALEVTVAYRAMPESESLAADFAVSYRQLARLAVVAPHARCSELLASIRARQQGMDADRRRAFSDFKRWHMAQRNGSASMHEWKKRFVAHGASHDARPDSFASGDWSHLVTPDAHGPTFFSRFTPARPGVALAEVFRLHAETVSAWLDRRGALLFRGFDVSGPRELELLCRWIGTGPCESREETSPRSRIVGGVYTATEYPAQYAIAFHNESSYQAAVPGKLLFLCMRAPQTGGATRLADCRALWHSLPDALRQPFAEHGYRLTRTYHPNFGLSWRQAFGVDDRERIAALAERDGIALEWKAGDVLTTTQVRPCVAVHPRTGERCWTNHMYFFHHTNLPEPARAALAGDDHRDYLVNDTRRADGRALEPDMLERIGRAYETNALSVDWQPGDVLLVDNISVAHGRGPYSGARELYFAQTEPIDWTRLRGTPESAGEGA